MDAVPELFALSSQQRPLLRLSQGVSISAAAIVAGGFSGVIIDGSTPLEPMIAFARECRAKNLSVWLDISHLHAPREELQSQRLVFHDLKPHFEIASNELDTLHAASAPAAIEILQAFEGDLTGAIFDATPRDENTLFPAFPWSETLPASFSSRHGFNILNRIETLISSGGDEAARVRTQFWDEIKIARDENFLMPVRAWCKINAMQFCAREFQNEWSAFSLSENLRARLDAARFTLDGAPAFPLTLRANENPLREFHALLRAGAGAFARDAGLEYSRPNSSRRIGAPPEIMQNEIIARAANLVAATQSAAQIGVLFPARSSQTHYHPDGHRFTRWVGNDLQMMTDLLDDLHFDWLFVQENHIIESERAGSTLHVGINCHELKMIVVPSVSALSWQAWQKLEEFAENGGRVACLGLLPRWSERGRDRALEQLIGKATRVVIEDLYQAYAAWEGEEAMPPTIGYPVFREYHSGGRLCSYLPRLNADAEDARLRVRQILHESVTPVFETLATNIRYAHRIFSGDASANADLFLAVNEGEEAAQVNARLRPREIGAPFEYEAATGKTKPIFEAMPYSQDEGGGIGLSFELAPAQMRFFQIAQNLLETYSLERATFDVEFFDGQTASGPMLHSGTPQIALRQNGRIVWHAGEDMTVPAALLLDGDDWNEADFDGGKEYSQAVTIPADWKNCRVQLEIARAKNPIQIIVNDADAGLRISPPFRFDVSLFMAFGASNDFTLRVWSPDANDAPPARLVAYPLIEVKISP